MAGKKIVKIMNAEHVTTQIMLDNPKAGNKLLINKIAYKILADNIHGLVAQLDPTYTPHQSQSKGWMFTRWGVIVVVVLLTAFIILKLSKT